MPKKTQHIVPAKKEWNLKKGEESIENLCFHSF